MIRPILFSLLAALLTAVPAAAEAPRIGFAEQAPASADAALAQSIAAAWNPGGLDAAARQTRVVVLVLFGPDARPEQVVLVDSDGPTPAATEAAFQSARSAALRALLGGAEVPEAALKAGLELVFDPRVGVS